MRKDRFIVIWIATVLMLSFMLSFRTQISPTSAQGVASIEGIDSDEGVDTDEDGKHNYLKIGVAIDVAESGIYEATIDGLRDVDHNYISVHEEETVSLGVGLQVVYISLYGPAIYESKRNANMTSSIYLYRIRYESPYTKSRVYVDESHNDHLSREYSYTAFDPPFTDTDLKFVVYPDGKVAATFGMAQELAQKNPSEFSMQGVIDFARSGGSTQVFVNLNETFTPVVGDEFPYNATELTFDGQVSGDLLDGDVTFTITFPPLMAGELPFNVTDFTVDGTFAENHYNGTITVHAFSGLPLGDVTINVEGNRTRLLFDGTVSVLYGVFPIAPPPEPPIEVNQTMVQNFITQLSTNIPGQGNQSLYNMTDGMLECTSLTLIPTWESNGATIDYAVAIEGDLVQLLAYMMTQGMEPQFTQTSEMLDKAFYSLQSATCQVSYSYAQKKASGDLSFVVNATKLVTEVAPVIASLSGMPPDFDLESLLTTTLCSLESAEISFVYSSDNYQARLTATGAIEGNLNAWFDLIKEHYMGYIATHPPSNGILQWQQEFFNQTQVDITNLWTSFSFDETSIAVLFENATVSPPRDDQNATSFRLQRFFNLTAESDNEDPYPRKNEKLKVMVQGGSNISHTVTPFRPTTVPEPDLQDADERSMTWFDIGISDLKDLTFNIEKVPGVCFCHVTNPEDITPDSPFSWDSRGAGCPVSFDITQLSEPITLTIRNVTEPEPGEIPQGWTLLGSCVEILASETAIDVNVTLRMHYADGELNALGLDESTLQIHFWNGTEWVPVESQVNVEENYVWTVAHHFSAWAVMGQSLEPLWNQLWFGALIVVIVVAIVGLTGFYLIRKRKPTPIRTTTEKERE